MENTGALWEDIGIILFNQGRISEGKDCRVEAEGPDGLVNVTFTYSRQIAEPGKKTRMLERAPERCTLGGPGRRDWRGSIRRHPQDHIIKNVRVRELFRGEHITVAFDPFTNRGIGPRRDARLAKKANVDDFDGLSLGNELCALSGDSLVVVKT